MKIKFSKGFLDSLEKQVRYIAQDKKSAAKKFRQDVFAECKALVDFPYRCRRSIYADDDNVRDLIFKGYTIAYRIDDERIVVFALVRYSEYNKTEDSNQ